MTHVACEDVDPRHVSREGHGVRIAPQRRPVCPVLSRLRARYIVGAPGGSWRGSPWVLSPRSESWCSAPPPSFWSAVSRSSWHEGRPSGMVRSVHLRERGSCCSSWPTRTAGARDLRVGAPPRQLDATNISTLGPGLWPASFSLPLASSARL